MAFFSSSIWQLIVMSDWVSKYIVMLGLFILSIVSVAVIIYKVMIFLEHKKQMRTFMQYMINVQSMHDLLHVSNQHPKSLAAQLVHACNTKLPRYPITGNQSVDDKNADLLQFSVEQDVDRIVRQQEQYIPFLGITAAVSPLLGLFGTVCGLIYAFMCISQEKSADIATVAPGISAALMTTLAGLAVAIPAMIAFHYLSHALKKLEYDLYDIADLTVMLARNRKG